VKKIGKAFEEAKQERARFNELKNKQTMIIEQAIIGKINDERAVFDNMEKRLTTQIKQQYENLKAEINRDVKDSIDNIDTLKSGLENDLPKYQEALNMLKLKREKAKCELSKKIKEEIMKLNGSVERGKKDADESEEALLEILKDVFTKLRNELEAERNERISTEDTLLTLLEQTCTKLTSSFNQL